MVITIAPRNMSYNDFDGLDSNMYGNHNAIARLLY